MDSVQVVRPPEKIAEVLAAEVRRWRLLRGWTRRELARRVSFDLSYVARIEGGKPSENIARRCDMVLEAGGRIWALWEEYREARAAIINIAPDRSQLGRNQLERTLRIERDACEQQFDGTHYLVMVRREFRNATEGPIVRCPVGIAAGHFVGVDDDDVAFDPHHGAFWQSIEFAGRCGDLPMRFKPEPYPDRLAEGWLYFENDDCQFPLYPGRSAVVEYTYRVPRSKWGDRLERGVALPTSQLSIKLVFPAPVAPMWVWGVEDSTAASERPLRSEIERSRHGAAAGDQWAEYEWVTTSPPLWTTYRLEWQFPQTLSGQPHQRAA